MDFISVIVESLKYIIYLTIYSNYTFKKCIIRYQPKVFRSKSQLLYLQLYILNYNLSKRRYIEEIC